MPSESSVLESGSTYPRGFGANTDWQWPLVPARKLMQLNYGRALKADARVIGDVPVYGTNGQCGWHNVALALGPGLILGRKGQGPLGVEWCERDFWVIDTAYYATTLTPEARLKYLYYLIRYVGLNHLKDGTSNPSLSRDVFGRQVLPLPSLREQDCIIEILGALDERIDLLRQTNATLEAIAQALFKSWFIDFDPVRAKAEGREPEGMDAATAALFPAEFEESALGVMPKGWTAGSVYEVASVIYGAPFASKQFNTDGHGQPLVRIRDLRDEAPGVWTPEVHPKGYLIQPGDIVVGMDGEFRAYLWGGESAWLNQRVCCFQPIAPHGAAFVRCSIAAPLAHIEATEVATTVIHLGKGDIDRFKVVVPTHAVAKAFSKLTAPLYARIVANKAQGRNLAAARDTLLPRLISGKLRLPEAREQVEEVLG